MDNLMVTDWEAGMSGIVWGSGDLYFTLDHSRSCSSHLYGYRCAEKPEARLSSSYTFVPLEVEVFALPTPFYKSASSTSSPKESGFTICATSPDNSDEIATKWLIEAHKQQRVCTVPLSQSLLASTDFSFKSSLFAVRGGEVSPVSSEMEGEGPLASDGGEPAENSRVGPLNPSLAVGTLRKWLISLNGGWKEGEEVLEFEYGPEAKQTELIPSESQDLDLEHPYTSAFKKQFAGEGGLGLLIGFANARLQHLKVELRGKESPRVVLDQLTLYQTIPHFAEVLFEHPQFLSFFLSYISDAARVDPR
jgi:hypothetical protein